MQSNPNPTQSVPKSQLLCLNMTLERRGGSTPRQIGSENTHRIVSKISKCEEPAHRRLVLAETTLEPALFLRVIAHFRVIRSLAEVAPVGCGSDGGTAANRATGVGVSRRRFAAKVDPSPSASLSVQIRPGTESLEPIVFGHLLLLLLLLLELINGAVHRAGVGGVAVSVGVAARARARRCGHVVI